MKNEISFSKERIKKALKIMRQSSGIKFEVIRDVYHLDPSHIESGPTFPTMETYMNYCMVFNHCPGWLLLLSCQVDQGKIKEAEFFDMVINWEAYHELAEVKADEFIRMFRKGISG